MHMNSNNSQLRGPAIFTMNAPH